MNNYIRSPPLRLKRESGKEGRKELLHLIPPPKGKWGRAQALQAAKQAVAGWEAGSVSSRRTSAVAANEAAEFAQLCHKVLRAVHRE